MDNVLNNIGDILVVKLEPKISGKVRIQSFSDSLSGITESRSVEREFRISQDGIFWSDWLLLTNENLSLQEYITDNSLSIEIRYVRTGEDATGTITFNDITFNGNVESKTLNAPTLLSSILNKAVGTTALSSLERNIFKKLYYRGIIPEYIERAANSDYEEDKDFVDLFFSIARFYSLFIIYFRRWEDFRNDYDLLREQVRGYGIYFDENNVTLQELQYLASHLFSQAQQRGTKQIFVRKGETLSNGEVAQVDGEFVRLTKNSEGDELLYENVPNWKVGWVMNQCSPIYKGTSQAYNLNKTKENTKDFENLQNFVLSNTGSSSYSLSTSSDGKRVLRLSLSGTGQVGLGRLADEDVSENLYTADSQMDYEITFAFKLSNSSSNVKILFAVEGFDVNKNYLNDAFVVPNGYLIENEFFNQSTEHWKTNQWYFARGIIHAYGSQNVDEELTNLGFGTNLYFNNSFVKYILPKIQVQSSISTSVEIWDYKIRPLIRGKNITPLKDGSQEARSLGFIQSPNFFYTYFRNNNNNQSQQEITDIIEKYLYPFDKIDLFTITGK